jgi:hypothetical protein
MDPSNPPWSENYDLEPGFWYTVKGTDVCEIDDIAFDGCISELCTSGISVTATDPAGGNLTYTYNTPDGGNIIGEGADVEFDPPNTGPHPCPYHVEITVTSDVSGLSVSQSISIYVKLAGDVTGDGKVNTFDLIPVRNQFGQSGEPGWIDADVNCDGKVNTFDLIPVRNQFGQSGCACP